MNPSPSPFSLPLSGTVLRAVLIDDEPRARHVLRALLAAHPEVTVCGESGDLDDATETLAAGGYDLVFLDVQLLGGTGFDLVPHVSPEARIIFVTAFDQHAVRAFEVNALDYLLKPVAPVRLAAALQRLARDSSAAVGPSDPPATDDGVAPPAQPLAPDDTAYVKTGRGSGQFLALAQIAAISTYQNYSHVHLASGETVLACRPLKTWEELLPRSHFARVHRLALVSLGHVRGIERVTGDTSLITVQGLAEPLRASYRYLPELRAKLPA